MVGSYTLVSLLLYFLTGRKFLYNTHNLLTNLLSVAVVPVIIIVGILVSSLWSSPAGRPGIDMLGLLAVPINPISESIYFFTRMERASSYMIMSLLPPLAMWLGIINKR
jgi:hypothetical protein